MMVRRQQHLHLKKRGRQDDMTDVETSTKRRRPGTTYVLEEEEKTQQRHEELADNKLKENINIPDNKLQNKNELKHEVDQVSSETNNTVTEDNNAKDSFDDANLNRLTLILVSRSLKLSLGAYQLCILSILHWI